jgi:hypothetical protein
MIRDKIGNIVPKKGRPKTVVVFGKKFKVLLQKILLMKKNLVAKQKK